MTAVGTLIDRATAMVERINAGDLDGHMTGCASTAIPHGYPEGVTDFNSLRDFYRQLLDACDGFRVEILRAVEQDDVVALQFVLQGRHTASAPLSCPPPLAAARGRRAECRASRRRPLVTPASQEEGGHA